MCAYFLSAKNVYTIYYIPLYVIPSRTPYSPYFTVSPAAEGKKLTINLIAFLGSPIHLKLLFPTPTHRLLQLRWREVCNEFLNCLLVMKRFLTNLLKNCLQHLGCSSWATGWTNIQLVSTSYDITFSLLAVCTNTYTHMPWTTGDGYCGPEAVTYWSFNSKDTLGLTFYEGTHSLTNLFIMNNLVSGKVR